MKPRPWTKGNRLVGYDPDRRRLWVAGQRVHHGMTGVFLTAVGTALMLHDLKDRSMWFERGPGTQQ